MRDGGHLTALLTLALDEVLQQFLGEHAAGGQVVVIGFQRVQRILQTYGQALQLGLSSSGRVYRFIS